MISISQRRSACRVFRRGTESTRALWELPHVAGRKRERRSIEASPLAPVCPSFYHCSLPLCWVFFPFETPLAEFCSRDFAACRRLSHQYQTTKRRLRRTDEKALKPRFDERVCLALPLINLRGTPARILHSIRLQVPTRPQARSRCRTFGIQNKNKEGNTLRPRKMGRRRRRRRQRQRRRRRSNLRRVKRKRTTTEEKDLKQHEQRFAARHHCHRHQSDYSLASIIFSAVHDLRRHPITCVGPTQFASLSAVSIIPARCVLSLKHDASPVIHTLVGIQP